MAVTRTLITIATIVAIATPACSMDHNVMNTYKDPDGQPFINMKMLDNPRNEVLVSTQKGVYRLSEDLSLRKEYSVADVSDKEVLKQQNKVILCSSYDEMCAVQPSHGGNHGNLHFKTSSSHGVDHKSYSVKRNSILIQDDVSSTFIEFNDVQKRSNSGQADVKVPVMSHISDLDLDPISKMFVKHRSSLPDGYSMVNIYSFTVGDHTYMVSRVSNGVSAKVTTRIARFCKDHFLSSYVEIQLTCHGREPHSLERSVVQAAYYDSTSETLIVSWTQQIGGYWGICHYELSQINSKMDETVSKCYNGSGRLGPANLHTPTPCTVIKEAKPSITSCQRPAGYYPLEGLAPLHQSAHFIELNLGEPVQKILMPNTRFVYAMTNMQIFQIDMDLCRRARTCHQCIELEIKLCGWCAQENRCTSEPGSCGAAGPQAPYSALISAHKGSCPITPGAQSYVSNNGPGNPENVLHSNPGMLLVSWPRNPSKLRKVLSNLPKSVIAQLAVTNGRLNNLPNSLDARPVVSEGRLLVSEFEMRGRRSQVKRHVKREVKRDASTCRNIMNCTSCLDTNSGCKWCHVRGLCIEAAGKDCPNQNVPAVKSASSCARLETSSRDTDVVVHSGQNKQITIRVANLQPDQMTNANCLFTYGGETFIASASVTSSNLMCESHKFEYADPNLPIQSAMFSVTSGANSVFLDNPQNIKVRIYKCRPMVTNCGQCLSMDPEYECGWCLTGDAGCSLQSDCPQASDWLVRSSICPNPQILRFEPLTAPIKGRTNITVTGLNLGNSYTDLEVSVAGVPCIVQPYEYESSLRFICQAVGPKQVKEGLIKVTVAGKHVTESQTHFRFVDPTIASVLPSKGPMSGGTTLLIGGEHMNAGTMTTVNVGGNQCTGIIANASSLQCVVGQNAANDNMLDVEVNFNGLRKFAPEKYTYVSDPDISMVEPKVTILSGGTSITAMGSNLHYIQNPQFFIEVKKQKYASACTRESNTGWLLCKTPRLYRSQTENISDTNPYPVHYGFNLDGVMTYKNISKDPAFGPMMYYPDPAANPLAVPGGSIKKYERDQKLVITGNFRNINPMMQDVGVSVGNSPCVSPMASDDAISCIPPEKPSHVDGDGNCIVILSVGNMRQDVGYMQYYDTDDEQKPIAIGIILGVVLPIIAIIVLLAVCVIRRHRKHKPSENYIPDVWKEEGQKEGEEVELNHVSSIKADMNGSIPDDKDTEPYIEELLSKVDEDTTKQSIRQILIPRRKLDIGDLIGKGNFGVSYKATFSVSDEGTCKDVAAKTIQGSNTDSQSVAMFLKKVSHLHNLQHPGILPIVGVCITVADDPILVTPYAQNGDLKTYVMDSNKDLKVQELLDFSLQIAEAMEYLSNQDIVHGNLALRNCLLTSTRHVQVGDYGLHTELFTPEVYKRETDRHRALVKWTAPEILADEGVTIVESHSDVWSYGVVMWELLTRGVTPYPDVETPGIVAYLTEGNRLKKPKQCPEEIYNIMLRCWTLDCTSRPPFRQVVGDIRAFTSLENDDGDQNVGEKTPLQDNMVTGATSEVV